MHKRLLSTVLCICLFLPLAARAEIPEAFRESQIRRLVYMPDGAGPFQYYAQNDPIWDGCTYEAYEATYLRRFGEGGCNPTVLAMIFATLLPRERLPDILNFNNPYRQFTLCEHSLNEYHCRRYIDGHGYVTLETPEDFLLTLPLVLGNYATGNNPSKYRFRVLAAQGGGTSMRMIEPLAEGYGLTVVKGRTPEEMFAAIDDGAMVLALCSGAAQPFSGTNGHYIIIASYDEEYLYIMDPYLRGVYKKDKHHIIEKIESEPGLLRVKIEDIPWMCVGAYSFFYAPEN